MPVPRICCFFFLSFYKVKRINSLNYLQPTGSHLQNVEQPWPYLLKIIMLIILRGQRKKKKLQIKVRRGQLTFLRRNVVF